MGYFSLELISMRGWKAGSFAIIYSGRNVQHYGGASGQDTLSISCDSVVYGLHVRKGETKTVDEPCELLTGRWIE
jgi:hypothetical protein